MLWLLFVILLTLVGLIVYDVLQRHHAILRNFPIVGHFRYLLEMVGPELRQYVVTSNNEERPFSRDERRWVYASSKKQNNYFGFGTDNDLELSSNSVILRHAAFPLADVSAGAGDKEHRIPCAKVLGQAQGRARAFRPDSVVNVSGMSYGSLGATAVEALNRGCLLAGCLHNTGEGGVSPYHQHSRLVWQIGTGYFGCRDAAGRFDVGRFVDVVADNDVDAIEIKLSQGAKPGIGGLLPAVKLTHELSEIRGVPMGRDCISPSRHSAFGDADGMLDFVEMLADRTGLPVGIKSAVGELAFWRDLVRLMEGGDRGVDFVTIDGGEGGTGAGPLVFADHVAMPFKVGMSQVYPLFAETGLNEKVVFIGSGKLGFPESALLAFAQARLPRVGAAGVRTRLRHDQRGPRSAAGDRLHPGATVSYEPLPDRRDHAVAMAHARARPDPQGGATRELRRDAAQGDAPALPGLRREPPRPHDRRPIRHPRRPLRHEIRPRTLRLPGSVGTPVRSGPRRDRTHHGRVG